MEGKFVRLERINDKCKGKLDHDDGSSGSGNHNDYGDGKRIKGTTMVPTERHNLKIEEPEQKQRGRRKL